MNQESDKPKYIIVLGTTYSGSGAVYDYLAGRGDLHDPLGGEEYQLPQVPNGLMALEAAAGKAFHPAVADYALVQFDNVVQRLARPHSKWGYGKNYAYKIPGFCDAVAQFVDEVSSAHLAMRLDWHRLMQSRFQYSLERLLKRMGFHYSPPETRLLVSREELVAASQSLHDRLFREGINNCPVLLNQAGSGWNPIESTKYFSSCKLVLVTRDPRDQFVDIKKHKKAIHLEGFIDWYNEMQSRLEGVCDSRLLHIRFEDFVNSHDQSVRQICDHLKLPLGVESTYQVELSRKNVGLYRSSLDKREAEIIKGAVCKDAEDL